METLPQHLEASCAICSKPAGEIECPHEGQSLEKALDQAMLRWAGYKHIREWALHQARDAVMQTFEERKRFRIEAHLAYLHTLPYFTLYTRSGGTEPNNPQLLAGVRANINNANAILQQGVDADWKASCIRYPAVLDECLSLVTYSFPLPPGEEHAPRKAVRERRNSMIMEVDTRKKERKRSRERHHDRRTPPPLPYAPMPGTYRR